MLRRKLAAGERTFPLNVSVDEHADDSLTSYVKLDVGGSFQLVVEKIAEHHQQSVPVLKLLDRCPDREQFLLDHRDVLLGLEQAVDDEISQGKLRLLVDKLNHDFLEVSTEDVVLEDLSSFKQFLDGVLVQEASLARGAEKQFLNIEPFLVEEDGHLY